MRRAQQCRYFASSLPPSKRHSRLTIVRRGCNRCRIAGIHGEAMYTAPTLRSACSPVDLQRRPQAAQSPNPPQRKQNSPAPGPKPGGGAGAEGRAAAAARRPKAAEASPPTLFARAERRGRGRRRGRRLRRRPTAARTGQGRLTTDDAPAAGHGRRRPAGTGGRSGTPQRARRLLPPADAAICEAGAAGAVKGQSR